MQITLWPIEVQWTSLPTVEEAGFAPLNKIAFSITHRLVRSGPPLSAILLVLVSVTRGQPRPENIKRKIPSINNSCGLSCAPFGVTWWNLMLSWSVASSNSCKSSKYSVANLQAAEAKILYFKMETWTKHSAREAIRPAWLCENCSHMQVGLGTVWRQQERKVGYKYPSWQLGWGAP